MSGRYKRQCRVRREVGWRRKLALWAIACVIAWMVSVFLVLSAARGQSLLDFTSPYCAPCQSMRGTVDAVEAGGVAVQRIDISTPAGQRAAQQWRVANVPTFVAVDASGREVGRVVGATSGETLRRLAGNSGWQPITGAAQPPAAACIVRAASTTDGSDWKCTGTFIGGESGGDVITCWHILRDAKPPFVVEFSNGAKYQANLIGADERLELALFQIRPPANVAAVSVSGGEPIGQLTAGGFGGGPWRTVAGKCIGREQHWYVMDGGNVRSGDSGGPVLDAAGNLAGVLWGTADQQVRFCGAPYIRAFIQRCRQRTADAIAPQTPQPPRPQLPPTTQQPQQPQQPQSETRFAAIDAELRRLNKVKAGRDEVAVLRTETIDAGAKLLADQTAENKSFRNQLDEAKHGAAAKIDAVHRDLLAKLPTVSGAAVKLTMQNLLIAAGVSTGGAGVAAWLGGRIAARGIRRIIERKGVSVSADASGGAGARGVSLPSRRANSASQKAAVDCEGVSVSSVQPFPVAIDSPPLPQVVATEKHYVPYEVDSFRKAHSWASDQIVRKYPGATDIMLQMESLIQQQMAGRRKQQEC